MAADIGAKLKVTGESSYSKAMREAAKNTKALDSELKLAEAQFKATGDAQELMTSKDKILREQLDQQKKAVETATEALQFLAQKGYEQNSTKVLEWRSKLAQAQQQVLELESAIQDNAASAQSAGDSYDDLGESLQQAAMDAETAKANLAGIGAGASDAEGSLRDIGKAFGWEGLSDTLNSITEKVNTLIGRAVQAGKALWDAGVDASVWADTLLTDSAVSGIDTQTLQRWQYAARFVDTSVDTIISSQTKLERSMTSDSADMAAAFATLHVATRNIDGSLRDVNDVFWDVISALGDIDNPTAREAKAMDILGKSAKELNPLIKAGREEWERYADAAPLISEEKVTSLGAANDAIEDMNAQLEALKLDLLAELAPTFEIVASSIATAAGSLKEYIDSPEGAEAFTNLQNAVSGLIKDFTDLDFGQILSDASGSIAGIVNGLSDILKDKDSIKQAFEAIGFAIAGLNLANAAAAALSLAASLKIIWGGKAASSAIGTAAAGGSAIAGAPSLLARNLGPISAVAMMGATAVTEKTEFGRTLAETGDLGKAVEATKEKIQSNLDTFESDWAGLWDAVKRDLLGISEVEPPDPSIMTQSNEALQRNLQILRGIVEGDLSAYAFDDMQELTAVLERYPDTAFARMSSMWDSAESWYESTYNDDAAVDMAQELLDAMTETLSDGSDDISEAASGAIGDGLDQAEDTIGDQPKIIGTNVDIGLANGLIEGIPSVTEAASSVVAAAMDIFNSGFAIGSPSKVMKQIGAFLGEGLAIGMDDTQGMIESAAQRMTDGVILRAAAGADTVSRSAGAESSVPAMILSALSHMSVQIDGQDAGRIILPTMEELMTDQMMSRRYE